MPIATKWPRLVVVGQPVTEEQADEILIRTYGWYIATNDRGWERQITRVAAEFGMPAEPPETAPSAERVERWRHLVAWRGRMGVLDLEYLANSQIVSCWIGGPHGWCDWSGRIGCSDYNIGKWPSDEEVTDDWQTIAAAFPYLDLTAQCVDDEGEGRLAAQWTVREGQVAYDPEPTSPLVPVLDEPEMFRVLMPGGERGVSVERLRQALARVAAKEGA